jgi:hypothetical protein
MKKVSLDFKLSEAEGNYGILFQEKEPIGFAMFNKEDYSLTVALRKNKKETYSKGLVMVSVFNTTGSFFGMNNYYLTENNHIVDLHYKKYSESNG